MVILIVICLTFPACNTKDKRAFFSGTLIDVEGKPIQNHIVTLYPIEMSETGSAIFQPIVTIAASPDFQTARTDKNGTFTFTDDINPGMIRLDLIPSHTLQKIRKQDNTDFDLKREYELVSVKIGPMTFYTEEMGGGSTTFSLQPDINIKNAVIIAQPNMWIEGKIMFADKKPLSNAPVIFKTKTRKTDKTGESEYGDRIRNTDKKGRFHLELFFHHEPKLYRLSIEYQGLSAETEEFLIEGGTHHKGLTLTLNGDSSDIPENPKPPEPVPFPGMMPLPKETTPEEWIVNPVNGHAYIRILCESIEAAKAQATTESAYLVAINDETEQKWISGIFGYKLYWIGLHKSENDSEWQWENGEPLTYTNWGPKDRFQPDYVTESPKTAAVMTFVNGEWHAISSDDLFWNVTKWALLEKDNLQIGTPTEDR